jgi:CRP-like cAMP-binding protein
VASGRVQIVKAIDDDPRPIKQLSTGQYFGEIALFDDDPRWDGAVADQDCTLLKLDKHRFISLISQRPHIILEVCRFLSQRLRETDRYYAGIRLGGRVTQAVAQREDTEG